MAQAVVIEQYGGPEVLNIKEVQVGPPQANEVRLRHTSIGVNFHDVYVRSGLYKTLQLPGIPGIEAAGVVTECGSAVTRWKVGDRVAYITGAYGVYASERVIDQAQLLRIPAGVSDEVAASALLRGLTAEMLLRRVHHVAAGSWILVQAAAGGVGQAALQVALRTGARVYATASGPKQARLLEQGCAAVFDSRSLEFVEPLLAATGGRGVDVVLNSLKGEWVDASFEVLAPGGRFVELGKIEIWSRAEAASRRPDATYLPFDLLEVAAAEPQLIRGLLEQFLRDELVRRGYDPVYTPHVGRLEMYRTSGHFPYYRDAQFPPLYHHPAASALDLLQYRLASGPLDEAREREMGLFLSQASLVIPGYAEAKTPAAKLEATARQAAEILRLHSINLPDFDRAVGSEAQAKALLVWLERQEGYLLKPMNCPHHIQIFKAVQRSYRDLPVRLAEFGTVYRYEQTGELSGMTRVRGFTQDDAHLFVTPEQVEEELRANIELVRFVLKTLGLGDYRVRIGLRAKGSDKYVGSDDDWNAAEAALLRIVKSLDMPHTAEEGEAAFYGPKIDFVVRDCIGREWQLGTVQLDYNLPRRFDLEYIGADNKAHRPVMIHRAPFGSMERFMGILIEHFAGAFPTWLAPEQVRVLPVSEKAAEYARGVEARLRAAGLRATSDLGSDKIGARIRAATLDKVPYMAVVGEKEAQSGGVAARDRVAGDLGTMGVDEFIGRLDAEIRARRLPGG